MPGPNPKTADKRQRRNLPRQVALNEAPLATPSPSSHWLTLTSAEWVKLWASPLAQAISETDLPALTRLFELRDQQQRHFEAARLWPTVDGSAGQIVLNPEYKRADALHGPILALEKEFGLTPNSKVRLGLSTAKAHATLAELAESSAEEDESDPRDG